MEPGLNLLHAISLFGRYYFALLLVIRPGHFGKRTWLYRGVGLLALLGALLRLARGILRYVAGPMWALTPIQRVTTWKLGYQGGNSASKRKAFGYYDYAIVCHYHIER